MKNSDQIQNIFVFFLSNILLFSQQILSLSFEGHYQQQWTEDIGFKSPKQCGFNKKSESDSNPSIICFLENTASGQSYNDFIGLFATTPGAPPATLTPTFLTLSSSRTPWSLEIITGHSQIDAMIGMSSGRIKLFREDKPTKNLFKVATYNIQSFSNDVDEMVQIDNDYFFVISQNDPKLYILAIDHPSLRPETINANPQISISPEVVYSFTGLDNAVSVLPITKSEFVLMYKYYVFLSGYFLKACRVSHNFFDVNPKSSASKSVGRCCDGKFLNLDLQMMKSNTDSNLIFFFSNLSYKIYQWKSDTEVEFTEVLINTSNPSPGSSLDISRIYPINNIGDSIYLAATKNYDGMFFLNKTSNEFLFKLDPLSSHKEKSKLFLSKTEGRVLSSSRSGSSNRYQIRYYALGGSCLSSRTCQVCQDGVGGDIPCLKCTFGTFFKDCSGFSGCHSSCLTCSGTSSSECSTCLPGKHLTSGVCGSCPTGQTTTPIGGICRNCSDNCQSCSSTPTTCISCTSNRYLLSEACVDCDSSCSSCSAGGPSDCSSCPPTKFLNDATSTCVDNCPSDSYSDSSHCKKCDANCLTCLGTKTSCTSCDNTDPSKQFLKEETKVCVPTCPTDRYFLDGNVCKVCDSNCLRCSGSSTSCTKCDTATLLKLLLEDTKVCVDSCPGIGYYTQGEDCIKCDPSCKKCSGSKLTCTECSLPFILNASTNKCLGSCTSGTYLSNGVCSPCSGNCKTCENSDVTCQTCPMNKLLKEDTSTCVDSCSEGFYPGNSNTTCKKCHSECLACIGSDSKSCTSCQSPKLLLESSKTCHDLCPQGYEAQSTNCVSSGDIFKAEYALIQPEFDSQKQYDLIYRLELLKNDNGGQSIDFSSFVGQTFSKPSFQFNLQEINKDQQLAWKIYWTGNNQIFIEIQLPSNLDNDASQLTLISKISTNRVFLTNGKTGPQHQEIHLVQAEQQLKFTAPIKIPPEQINQAKSVSKAMASTTLVATSSTSVINAVTMTLSMDQSGATLKFSQISKLISRLRLSHIKYGELLSTFLDQIGAIFDKKGNNLNNILNYEKGRKGKLSFYQVNILFYDLKLSTIQDNIKVLLYFLSWSFKFILFIKLNQAKKAGKITRCLIKSILIHRKIHFLLYNLNIIDISFYGTRTLAHCKLSLDILIPFLITITAFMLSIIDTLQIFWISSGSNIFKLGSLDKRDNSSLSESREELQSDSAKNSSAIQMVITNKEVQTHNLDPMELTKLGYIKTLDFRTTIANLQRNEVIEKHATSELRVDDLIMENRILLLANFLFLLRIIVYQMFLVLLPYSPQLQILLFFSLELSYLLLVIWAYNKHKYLKYIYIFLSKAGQSLFLLFFHIICLMIVFGYFKQTPPATYQKIGMYCVLLAVLLEYLFLLVNLFYIIKNAIHECKKNRKKPKSRREDDLDGILVYNWIYPQERLTNKTPNINSIEGEQDKRYPKKEGGKDISPNYVLYPIGKGKTLKNKKIKEFGKMKIGKETRTGDNLIFRSKKSAVAPLKLIKEQKNGNERQGEISSQINHNVGVSKTIKRTRKRKKTKGRGSRPWSQLKNLVRLRFALQPKPKKETSNSKMAKNINNN